MNKKSVSRNMALRQTGPLRKIEDEAEAEAEVGATHLIHSTLLSLLDLDPEAYWHSAWTKELPNTGVTKEFFFTTFKPVKAGASSVKGK
jgi:hypothetical protein